jgi:hypothetical protein
MDLIAKANILHDEKRFEPGDLMKKIKKEEAERLIELGAAIEESKKDEKEE